MWYSFQKFSGMKNRGMSYSPRTINIVGTCFSEQRLRFASARFSARLLSRSLLALIFLFCRALVGSHHHQHGAAFHLRRDLDRSDICQGGGDLLQIFERDLGVIHFSTAELDRDADLMSLKQPAPGIVHFETAVRFVRLRAQTDFLDLDLGLRFLRLTVLLGPFVDELAVIDHTADRRVGVGGDLHKIQLGVACDLQSLAYRHNADVATIRTDQANLRDADALIYSKF